MSFFESPRFPERISYGLTGGPEFATTIIAVESGNEASNSSWIYPRQSFNAAHVAKSQAEFEELRNFFMVARGRKNGFRFKDWSDYAATNAEGRATAITSTTFQMVKRYTAGSETIDRPIRKPISATLTVLVSGVPPTYSVDATTGILTIAAAPAAANISWSGQFDVPMRFDVDKLDGNIISANPRDGFIYEWGNIPLLEWRG